MKKISLVIALIFCVGCAFAARNFYEREADGLALHMSKDQVTEKLGEPTSSQIQTIDGVEYEVCRFPIQRFFAKNYKALDTSYYEIFFFEDRVTQWRRVKIYAHPEHELKTYQK